MKYSPFTLPLMMGRLSIASWETILHRTRMMADGSCTVEEYQRMGTEKLAAMQSSAAAMMAGGSHSAILAPFVTKARENARRLRGG